MNRIRCFLLCALSCAPLLAATPLEDARAGIDKLRAAPNYAWKTTTTLSNISQQNMTLIAPIASQGKLLADGTTRFTLKVLPLFAPPCEFVLRGKLGAVRNASLTGTPAWISLADLAQGDPRNLLGDLLGGASPATVRLDNRELMSRLTLAVANFKSPTFIASDLVTRMRQLKAAGTTYSGEIAAATVAEWIGASGYFAGYEFTLTTLKGTGTLWVTKGILSKFEYTLTGIAPVQSKAGFSLRRTTEILDVGTTKVEVPREAF